MTIVWRAVSHTALGTALQNPTAVGVYWQADATTCLLELPQHVRFQVNDGIVQYACLGDLGEKAVRMLGAGVPAAAAWMQQGYLALHAATVATPMGAVVLAGPSAAGKSALAAALALHGCPVLADEVAPLCLHDTGPLTTHAVPDCDILLWQDAMKQLGFDITAHASLRPGLPRYIVDGLGVSRPSPLAPAVRAIYLLSSSNTQHIQRTLLDGNKRVLSVIEAAFNRYLPQSSGFRQRTFLKLTSKLANVPVYRLLRPRIGWSISELADHVLKDLAS